MTSPLTHGELQRVRHARTPREPGAVLDDIEARIGRPVVCADLEEVVTGHYGRIPRTATFVRQLPGWGGAAQLYQLTPALATTLRSGEASEYAVVIVHDPQDGIERCGRPGEVTVTVRPATACGATWGGARFVGDERTHSAVSAAEAFEALGYTAAAGSEEDSMGKRKTITEEYIAIDGSVHKTLAQAGKRNDEVRAAQAAQEQRGAA